MRCSIIELKLKGVSIPAVKGFSGCLGKEVKPRFIVAVLVRLRHIKNGKIGDNLDKLMVLDYLQGLDPRKVYPLYHA